MQKSIFATGLAVAAANALLIVPESSSPSSDVITTLPLEAHAESHSRSLHLDCPSCPLLTTSPDGRSAVATTDVPNHLQLTFSVDQNQPTNRLLLNGFELFPHPTWAGPLKAVQLPDTSSDDGSVDDGEGMLRDLGYSFAVRPVGGAEDHSAELLEVSLRIVEIGNVVVERVPTVVAHVIRLEDGTLMMVTVETREPPAPPSTPSQCRTTFCRLHELIAQHLAALRVKISKHCGGSQDPGVQQSPSSPRPGHHGHHGHHGHGHVMTGYGRKHHSWSHLLRNIVSHILLPALIGVVAGVSASIIGMIIGTFAVCLWRVVVLKRPAFPRKLCRRGCRRGHRNAAHREEAANDDEKAGLMATTDAGEEGMVSSDDFLERADARYVVDATSWDPQTRPADEDDKTYHTRY